MKNNYVVIEIDHDGVADYRVRGTIAFDSKESACAYCLNELHEVYVSEVWSRMDEDEKQYDNSMLQLLNTEYNREICWNIDSLNGTYSFVDTNLEWGIIWLIYDIDSK